MEKHKCFASILYSFGNLDLSILLENISCAEYIILSKIEEYISKNDVEYIHVTKLSEELKVSTPAVSRILKGLENKKMINRTIDIFCKRNTRVRLTNEGKNKLEYCHKNLDNFFNEVFSEISQEEQQDIIDTFNNVYTRMYVNLQKYKGVM